MCYDVPTIIHNIGGYVSNVNRWSKQKIALLFLSVIIATFGIRYAIDNKEVSWSSDLQQSSKENNKVVADFFWNKGESLLRFLVDTNKCPERTEFESINVLVSGSTYNYRYACNDDGYMVIGPKDYESAARSMNKFEVSERYGDDVVVEFWGKTYTFDASGFSDAVIESNKRYRG
ncbi:hypothetical protein D9U34_01510 [Vibrio anguillarum]|nr:hypothetical protein D9U34_01510 [Vibrio anguillarum]